MVYKCTLVGLQALAIGVWLFTAGVNTALGQMVGSRWNESGAVAAPATSGMLAPDVATRYITIAGTAQREVAPTELRLVWAVTAEDVDPARSRQKIQERAQAAVTAWQQSGIPPEAIVEDFIAALPRFEWLEETRGEAQLLVENQTGYRIQTNLHVRAVDEEQALRIVDAALAAGITDLIAVDYMADLQAVQVETRRAAMEAALAKSDALLSPIFGEHPSPINVAERTAVHFPAELYASFENVAAEQYSSGYDDRRRRIAAYRPKNTYYRGSVYGADDRTYELTMKPKIVVESTVEVYYMSPAALKLHPPEKDTD